MTKTGTALPSPQITQFDLVWLAITCACNNRCAWCYADAGNEKKHPEHLDIERIGPIAGLLGDLQVKKVALIGGEPTVHPRLVEIVRMLVTKSINVHIVTNGRRIRDADFALRLRDAGLTNAGFSIEGPCAEVHDGITRVEGSFADTIQGARNSLSAGIGTYSNTTICRQNIDYLIKIAEFATSVGVRSVNFNICGPCISRTHTHSISPRVAAKAYEEVYQYLKAKSITTRLLTATPLCNFQPSLRAEMRENRVVHGGPCQLAHGRNFVVDFNGDVLPCTHLTGYPMFNMFEGPQSVITGDEFLARYNDPLGLPSQFRQRMRRYASPQCERGKCHESCAGGCPLFWTEFSPEEEITGSCPILTSA